MPIETKNNGDKMRLKDIPCQIKPCKNCPFRKDCLKGWLGEDRAEEICKAESFSCHKDNSLQCAGHLLLMRENNLFYRFILFFGIEPGFKGADIVFDTHEEMIKHHKDERRKNRKK